jgi:hypothetical protein
MGSFRVCRDRVLLLPDVQAYYDIRASQFIYFGRVRSRSIPRQYRNYDLYNGYKVVLNDYHGRAPYTYYKNIKQNIIKDTKESTKNNWTKTRKP